MEYSSVNESSDDEYSHNNSDSKSENVKKSDIFENEELMNFNKNENYKSIYILFFLNKILSNLNYPNIF